MLAHTEIFELLELLRWKRKVTPSLNDFRRGLLRAVPELTTVLFPATSSTTLVSKFSDSSTGNFSPKDFDNFKAFFVSEEYLETLELCFETCADCRESAASD